MTTTTIPLQARIRFGTDERAARALELLTAARTATQTGADEYARLEPEAMAA